MTFDRVSKKQATDCTPERAKIEIGVEKYTDPVTKRDILTAPDGYDPSKKDDVHKCNDVKPFVGEIAYSGGKVTAKVTRGTHSLETVEFKVNGKSIGSVSANSSKTYSISYDADDDDKLKIEVTVIDKAYYHGTGSNTVNIGGGG